MLEPILAASKSDSRLAALLDEAREYAQVYLLAKQRHKGCQGAGEIMTLKEELKDTIDKLIRYCKEKAYVTGPCDFEPDSIAKELVVMNAK
jgi:hypothetical protein